MSLNANCRDGGRKEFDPDCTLGPATIFGAADLVFLRTRQTDRARFQRSECEDEAKGRASQRDMKGRRATEPLEI
jgi:hypothetical protein